MKNIVGIDLGTTYSAISRLNELGKPEIAPFENGERLIASSIYFGDDKILVGKLARNQSNIDATRYVELVKRYMGEPYFLDERGEPRKILDKNWKPSELAGIILKKVKEDYELQYGRIDGAIITVPAYFDELRRQATMDAAKYAGIKVTGIINEPTAAGLYYATNKNLTGNLVVFDLGGGTFDVTTLKSIDNNGKKEVSIITSQGDHKLGGKDFDKEIVKDINQKYKQKYGKEYSDTPEKFNFLMNRAEEIKKQLSDLNEVKEDFPADKEIFNYSITRQEFEKMISPFFSKIEMLVENVMDDSKLRFNEIDHIILVGGSSRIPIVTETLNKMFKKDPTRVGNLDESVSLGAAIYCGIQTLEDEGNGVFSKEARENLDNINMSDVTNHSFGTFIVEFDQDVNQNVEVNDIIIPKDTKLPAEVTKTYYTVSDNQTAIEITITQGEFRDRKKVSILKETTMNLPSGRRRGQPVEVTYAYDKNGMMKCTFFDVKSGRRESVDLSVSGKKESTYDFDDVVNFWWRSDFMDNAKILTLISLGLGLFSFFYEYVLDALIFGIGGLICGIISYSLFKKTKMNNVPAIVVMVLNSISILYNLTFL